MKRELSVRESVLLALLAVLIIATAYFKLILEPINDRVTFLDMQAQTEQTEIITNTPLLKRMDSMEKELAELIASGSAKVIPRYDNDKLLLTELRGILAPTREYQLDFSDVAVNRDNGMVLKPADLSFEVDSYSDARAVIDALRTADAVNSISRVNIEQTKGHSAVSVSMSLTFYELI